MTIDEAIKHCKEVAEESRQAALSYARENAYETAISCKACGQEHKQLAELLTELKQRREHDVNRAAIMRLCNEIEDEVNDIAFNSCSQHTYDCCESIRDKLKQIGKELTGDDGTD